MSVGFTGKLIEEVEVTAAGIYYFKPIRVISQEKMGIQVELLNPASFAGTASIDLKSSEFMSHWCPFQVSGSTYTHTIAASTGIITGSVGKLTFTSISETTPGSEIVIVLEDTATAGAETVAVTYDSTNDVTAITVGIESGVSTAAQIIAAIEDDADADALVSVAETISGKMESAAVELAGGAFFLDLETAASYVRIKANVTAGTGTLRLYFVAKS